MLYSAQSEKICSSVGYLNPKLGSFTIPFTVFLGCMYTIHYLNHLTSQSSCLGQKLDVCFL